MRSEKLEKLLFLLVLFCSMTCALFLYSHDFTTQMENPTQEVKASGGEATAKELPDVKIINYIIDAASSVIRVGQP